MLKSVLKISCDVRIQRDCIRDCDKTTAQIDDNQ